jgi:hypothetical protein
MHTNQPVKRISALGALVFGVTAVAMTVIASGAAIVFYGMSIVDRKTDTLTGTVRAMLEELPAIRAALPPVLADAVNDERSPEYARQLKIEASLSPKTDRVSRPTPLVSVENTGDRLVSMLAVRVVALDESRNPLREWTEYLATPLAIEDEWRGPLLPGSNRRALLSRQCPKDTAAVECEVTELRVWNEKPAEAMATASAG